MSWVLWGLAVFVSKGQTVPLLQNPLTGFVNGTFFRIPNLALVATALFIMIQVVQDRTRFGRYLYAVGGDELLAAQAGVDVDMTKIIVFMDYTKLPRLGVPGLPQGLLRAPKQRAERKRGHVFTSQRSYRHEPGGRQNGL